VGPSPEEAALLDGGATARRRTHHEQVVTAPPIRGVGQRSKPTRKEAIIMTNWTEPTITIVDDSIVLTTWAARGLLDIIDGAECIYMPIDKIAAE